MHVQPDSNSTFRAVGHLFNPRGSVLTAADTINTLSKDPATGERTELRVPLYLLRTTDLSSKSCNSPLLLCPLMADALSRRRYYSGLKPGAEVQVQLMETILSEDGKTVDKAKLSAKGTYSAEM